jgi:broad specificity phosphatase PhoE
MARTTFRLVRHAEAEHVAQPDIVAGRAPYSNLTDTGREQAQQLGWSWLDEGLEPGLLMSSPIKRCISTLSLAAYYAEIPGRFVKNAETPAALAEQCLGRHEGKPRTRVYRPSIQRAISRQGAAYTHPGTNSENMPGESLLDVSRRMARHLIDRHQEAVSDTLVVVMSHHVAIKGMLSYLATGGIHDEPDPLRMHADFMERPAILPCSQTSLTFEGQAEQMDWELEYQGRQLAA